MVTLTGFYRNCGMILIPLIEDPFFRCRRSLDLASDMDLRPSNRDNPR